MTPVYSPTPADVIPWHRRLEGRVLFWVTVLTGVSLVAILFAASRVVTRASLERSSDDLQAARQAFDHLIDRQASFAAAQTQLITELPVFRAHLTDSRLASDPTSIAMMATEYRDELKAEFCIVTDAKGAWLTRPGWPMGVVPSAEVRTGIDEARAGRSSRAVVTLPDGVFLVVFEPALFEAGDVLGTMTAGYRLDAHIAPLATDARLDVSFVCDGTRICGSSLRPREREALASLLATDRASLGALSAAPALRRIGDADYVSTVSPLGASGAELVLQQPWQPTQLIISAIQARLLLVGVIALVAGMAGSLVFSRRLTRPLRELVTAANDVATGKWNDSVPEAGPVEARQMAVSFNHMTRTLSHWHAEANRRASELQDAYERFRAVTESAHDAIISVDSAGRIVFWNRRAEAVFGYLPSEAIGQPLTMLLPAEMAAPIGSPERLMGHTVEGIGLRRDGSEVPIELSLSTWRASAGVFYTGIVRDITDRRVSESALRQREEQLRQSQKMEAIGRLAGGVAHDFNNLLTAILGYADIALMELPPGADAVHDDLMNLRSAGLSAATLTRQLLAFGRRQLLQEQLVDLNQIAWQTENLLQRLIGEDIELVIKPADDLPSVKADPGQVEQVLMNLAVNARDAMPKGGRLTIETAAAGDWVIISVVDNGCGMSSDVRGRIFEPFFTTKDVGQGTGLGLATVYGIVQQSGGEIDVWSEPGRGTRFTIRLPMSREVASAVPGHADPDRELPGGTETVLLVEDNAAVRSLTRTVLTKLGYRVLEAVDGAEGLRIGADQLSTIDLLLTDVVMPGLGGTDLARRLSELSPGLPIIFTSGYTDDAIMRQGALEPGAAFIQKPFTPEHLSRLLRDVLDRARAIT